MTDVRVIRAIAYLRISDLRETDLRDLKDLDSLTAAIESFFADRERQLREYAQAISTDTVVWKIVKVIRENEVTRSESRSGSIKASAHKKRKIKQPDGSYIVRVWRPGFHQMLDLLRKGEANGILCENLNRVARDQRDGIDLRDVAQAHKINARSISGTLTLTDGGTRGERTMLGIMVEVAADFSENLSWSVAQGRERKAQAGEWGGGRRPFGFKTDGITSIQSEYDLIEEWSYRVLKDAANRTSIYDSKPAEHSLARMAREANAAGIPTVTGVKWRAETIKDILTRPRNAGIMVHQGKEIGKGNWEPIVSVSVFRAVKNYLTNPERATSPGGRPPEWLGSGVFLCGKCADGTTVNVTHKKPTAYKRKDGSRTPIDETKRIVNYRCSEHSHLERNRAHVDAKVESWIMNRLAQPDAITMFAKPKLRPTVDVEALEREKHTLSEKLKGMAAERIQGKITDEEFFAARDYAVKRLKEIEAALADSVEVEDPLAELVKSVNIKATWEGWPLDRQQAIIRRFARVWIMPTTTRGTGFDWNSVVIEPVEWEQAVAA
jgi:site-specific DNA recombinase